MIWSQLTCLTSLLDQDYVGSMTPQKLLCFYRLPTRGRVGTKIGDAWYVSNITIISDVSCLFYINYHMFYIHFMSYYGIYWNNLLTRCHSASSLFSAVFHFRKVIKELFLELDETKNPASNFTDMYTESKGEKEESHEPSTPCGGAGLPLATPGHGVGPTGATDHHT